MTMRIKLLHSLPVAPEHGMTEGRVLEVLGREAEYKNRGGNGWWVRGDSGARVKVLKHEAEVVPEPTEGSK